MLQIIFWFRQHLYSHLKLLLTTDKGASLSALVVAALFVYSIFKTKIDIMKWLETQLCEPRTLKILGAGILVMLVITLGTFSVYIVLEGTGDNQSAELGIKGRSSLPASVKLSRKNQDFLRILFYWPGSIDFELSEPAGYSPLPCKVIPGKAIKIHVPTDFNKKELHVLRLVPGWGILELLPEQGIDKRRQLKISFGTSAYRVPLGTQAIYIGANHKELELAASWQAPAEWVERLEAEQGALSSEEGERLRRLSKVTPLFYPTEELNIKDIVSIDLVFQDAGRETSHSLRQVIVSGGPSPQTIFLEDRTP